jgi:S1-C subfamily serine protease
MADPDVPGAMIPAAIAGIIVDELIRRSPSPSIAFGFRATDFSPEVADRISNARLRGAGVAIVEPDSDADKAGLRAGDVVVAVNAMPISSASELSRALDGVQTKATLTIMRGGQKLTMSVPRAIPGKS